MAKSKEKLLARGLRKKGESIKEIAKKLGVSVSSVSVWCRDIELTSKQIRALEKRYKDPHYGRRLSYLLTVRKRRKDKIKRLREIGIEDIGNLTWRELFLVGAALYWAEGFKKDSQVGLASSDSKMAQLFLRWLKKCCGYSVSELSLRVTANISHKYRIEDIEMYWSKELNISLKHFQKPYFQKVKWKKIYENPEDYFGVVRIKVRKSTDFLRKINGWIEGLKLQV